MTATFGPIHGLGVRALGAVRSSSHRLDASRKRSGFAFNICFSLLSNCLYSSLPSNLGKILTIYSQDLFWFSQAEEVPLTDGSLDGRAELIDMACSASLRIRPLKIRLWTA
jgi:hypothetical protein